MRRHTNDAGQPFGRTVIFVLAVLFPAWSSQILASDYAESSQPPPLDCVLEPYEVVEVSSAVQGVIDQIYVDRNDSVSKGQLLVELDSNVEKTQVDLARTRASLRTTIELRETELAFNQRSQQRLEKLYTSDTISLHVKDEADTDTTKSVLQLRNARDSQRLAELELAKAEAILELRSMRSPIDGVVVSRNKVAGEFVEDQSILRIAQLDPLRVEVIVPVERFGEIEAGMQVEVMPEHFGDGPRMATVTMVDRMIDPASGTFDVRAELPNPDHRIPSGLRCTVQFLDKMIPAASIAKTEDAGADAEPPAVATLPEPPREELQMVGVNAVRLPEVPELRQEELEMVGVNAVRLPEVPELRQEELEMVGINAVRLPEVPEPHREELEMVSINAGLLPSVSARRFAAEPASLSAAAACDAKVPARTQKYSVVADPIANLSTSDELLEALRAQGVNDYYLKRNGTDSGQIALGLFKYKGNAEQRLEDLALLGFKADIRIIGGAPVPAGCTGKPQFAIRD
jgi:RND family efflux transporter MFP subunit